MSYTRYVKLTVWKLHFREAKKQMNSNVYTVKQLGNLFLESITSFC